MSRRDTVSFTFAEYIPETLQEGIVYISIPFATATHRCCCGCGKEVVTPLSPTDWTLIYDGESISLDPSIGNWSLPCRSHYWIRRNRISWAPQWSSEEIQAGRDRDRSAKAEYFNIREVPTPEPKETPRTTRASLSQRIKRWWS